MDLNDYFDPVDLVKPDDAVINNPSLFGKNIRINTPSEPIDEISNYSVAIAGVPEDRASHNRGASLAPDAIRAKLYQLFRIHEKLNIIDLGNLKAGNTYKDTYAGLQDVLLELYNNQVVTVLIGGTQDLTLPCFKALEQVKNSISLVTVDSTVDVNDSPSASDNYLSNLLESPRLFRYANLGHQQYLADTGKIKELEDRLFDFLRLGALKEKLFLVEPYTRNCDLISFDIGAVKQGDAPGRTGASPNGFFSHEACQIARYAGMSDNAFCFGIYEINPRYDTNNITAHLAAQMIWHFLEGFSVKKQEYPSAENKDFKAFIVSHNDMEHDITFYKSIKTERWWMEVPVVNTGRKVMAACSFDDYKQACDHDIPDVWWKTFRKIN
ncbi:MAG: formimidoylglutamase [Bacteroidales bacterium]|nr:formimidoylglutamase [Bacteroidales bacterium]